MKLVSFTAGENRSIGALQEDNSVVDFSKYSEEYACLNNMQALIESGERGLALAQELALKKNHILDVDDYTLLAPIPKPVQMRDFMCFEKHLQQSLQSMVKIRAMELGQDTESALAEAQTNGELDIPSIWYQQPLYYKANRFAVSGQNEEINWPKYSAIMDYECELACVIAKQGRDIDTQSASDFIFGYTIFNDFSARDAQRQEIAGFLGPAKGKDFDKANAMGPCIVTADEFDPSEDHAMIVRVNGQQRSQGSSADMYWRFEDLLAHVSRGETLYPGEIFGSGTVGDGCGLELMQFLQADDVVELEIEGIGVLRNTVRRING